MRNLQETNAINRVMKAWGLGSLGEPGAIAALAHSVQDHEHFSELLRACEPKLRREMYDAMSPNLRFPAHPLEWYIIHAKDHASSQQFPTLTADGNLKPYMMPTVGNAPPILVPEEELWVQCPRCKKESFFYAERKADCISEMRNAGWAWNELTQQAELCPNCLDEVDGIAVDEAPS
jgi:hypothetical protein